MSCRYTIDPLTRYGTRLRTKTLVGLDKIKHLIDTDDNSAPTKFISQPSSMKPPSAKMKPVSTPQSRPVDNRPKPVISGATAVEKPQEKKSMFDQISEESRRKKRMRGWQFILFILVEFYAKMAET